MACWEDGFEGGIGSYMYNCTMTMMEKPTNPNAMGNNFVHASENWNSNHPTPWLKVPGKVKSKRISAYQQKWDIQEIVQGGASLLDGFYHAARKMNRLNCVQNLKVEELCVFPVANQIKISPQSSILPPFLPLIWSVYPEFENHANFFLEDSDYWTCKSSQVWQMKKNSSKLYTAQFHFENT